MAGVDVVHVPYRCAGPAVIDLVAGRVPARVKLAQSCSRTKINDRSGARLKVTNEPARGNILSDIRDRSASPLRANSALEPKTQRPSA
jgi:tripartite-type tricarboxylate transporter receptor subunit TctC